MEPKPGLVVRYDFLWKEDHDAGQFSGKDRPCAIILIMDADAGQGRRAVLCPITHSAPGPQETAVKIPPKVAAHLGLDDEQSWIKTDQVNRFKWPAGQIPAGISPDRKGNWVLGELPRSLAEQAFNQVRDKDRSRTLKMVERQDDVPLERSYKAKPDSDRLKRPEPSKSPGRKKDDIELGD